MQLTDAPAQIVLPFAADDATKTNPFPVSSQIPVTPGAASYTDGFPPLTAVDPADGGVGPSKADFNGVLYAMSAVDRWSSAGGLYVYSADFSSAIGGYPKGALLQQASGSGLWISTVDDNTSDPDTGGSGWTNIATGTVLRMSASVYASAQQTLAVGFSKILFDTVEFDSAGLWDAANKRFVATVAGKYRLSGYVALAAPGAQGPMATLVYKNGTALKQCFQGSQLTNQSMAMPFEAIVNCAVSDFLEAYVQIPETAVLAGTVGSNQGFVYAQLEYLGA